MRTRIVPLCAACFGTLLGSVAVGQTGRLVTDPETGITYREETRTYDRPVIEEEPRTRTIYRPEVVTEFRNEQQTVYTPTTQIELEPRLHGWWNPFRQPTLAYHVVPRTRWVPRTATVQRPQTVTRWVPETQTETTRVVRTERVYETVRRPVAPVKRASQIASAPPPQSVKPTGGVSRLAADPSRRNRMQRGMPATVLGTGGASEVATAPGTIWR